MRRFWLAVTATALLVACTGSDDRSPSSIEPPPSPSSSGSPSATAHQPAETPAVSATVGSSGTPSSAANLTGVDALDALTVAILASDTAFIADSLEYASIPCTGLSEPIPGPGCPDGVAVGALIDAFPRSGCEASFEPAIVIGPVVEGLARPGLALFGVFLVDSERADEPPTVGGYVLVFASRDSQFDAVTVADDGGILRWGSSCGRVRSEDFLAELPLGEPIVLALS